MTNQLPRGLLWKKRRNEPDDKPPVASPGGPLTRLARRSKAAFLVHAARTLGKVGETFGYEALVIAAWNLYPEKFGLLGGQYPDSHRVSGVLFAKCGPIHNGWLNQVGRSAYQLTDASYLAGNKEDMD